MNPTPERQRIRAIVHGRVQGVGFRYSARQQAAALGLSGWVRNCWDGTVEVEAEGPADIVAQFLWPGSITARWAPTWCACRPGRACRWMIMILLRSDTR